MELGPLLAGAVSADSADRLLLGTSRGRTVVRRLLKLTEEAGVAALVPASASGERLTGALLFQSGGRLRLWDAGTAEPVVIVDGVVASSIGVRRAMALAARLGASSVHGIAVIQRPLRCVEDLADITLLELAAIRSTAA